MLLALLVLLWPATALAADGAEMVGSAGAGGVGGMLLALVGKWAWARLFQPARATADKETPVAPPPPPRAPQPSLVDGMHLPALFAPLVVERGERALRGTADEQRALLVELVAEGRRGMCAGCERERLKLDALTERVTLGLERAVRAVEKLCDDRDPDSDGKKAP